MKEQASQPKQESKNHGLVPGAVHLALDVADRGQTTAIAVLHDARVELKSVVDGGIDYVEKATASLLRFAKKLSARIDEGAAEVLTNTEKLIGNAVKSARATTHAAAELAHTAGSGLTGERASA